MPACEIKKIFCNRNLLQLREADWLLIRSAKDNETQGQDLAGEISICNYFLGYFSFLLSDRSTNSPMF